MNIICGTWELDYYFNIIDPRIHTMCGFKQAIVENIDNQYAGHADTILAPICSVMYSQE